jgi:hypothetical protein
MPHKNEFSQFDAATYLKLKAAFRDLVAQCGGVSRCCGLTLGCQSKMSEAMSPAHMERMPTLRQIADLEAECGVPVVTRFLADMAGYSLAPQTAKASPQSMHVHLSQIIRDSGEFSASLAVALSDGTIDPSERAKLISQVNHLMDDLQCAKASLLVGVSK